MGVDVRQQRDRLVAAEAEVFAHYGIAVTSRRLVVEELGDMSVRVVTTGEGPDTVLLHGASMAAPVWAPLLPHLPGRTLHLVDLPSCGLTDPIDLGGSDYPGHQAAFVGGVLDALGLVLARESVPPSCSRGGASRSWRAGTASGSSTRSGAGRC